jgi:hypothetical protein
MTQYLYCEFRVGVLSFWILNVFFFIRSIAGERDVVIFVGRFLVSMPRVVIIFSFLCRLPETI